MDYLTALESEQLWVGRWSTTLSHRGFRCWRWTREQQQDSEMVLTEDGAVEGIPKKSGMDTSVGFAVGVEILVELSEGERLKFSGT